MATPVNPAVELIRRAVEALQRRSFGEASQLASAALKRFGPEANALMVLASVRVEAGELAEAIGLYEQARVLMPTHIHVLVNLASAYRTTGRLQEARRTLEAALGVDPRFAIAHNNLGNTLLDLGERSEALRAYQSAAELDPRYADPVAGMAWIAQEEHRLGDADGLAGRALSLAPRNVLARLTRARVRLRQDDATGAVAICEELLSEGNMSLTNRTIAYGALGEAYDKLTRYAEAFAAFAEGNTLQHVQCSALYAHANGPLSPAGIERTITFVESAEPTTWTAAPPAGCAPVFLVGFPRSGTTLLDQILASHSAVTTLEERDTLSVAVTELMSTEDAFKRFSTLSAAEIERLRDRYWQGVVKGLGGEVRTPVFIDKQPLNAVLLPLIHRLFPAAKIILALRDPRDVVLSSFQQRFGMNEAMFQLLRLDTATRYYDSVMRLVKVSRNKFPLNLHITKYEDLIGAFDATLRPLVDFLGLEWDENMRRYAETAKRRTISTPSAAQVVRPLYASSRGKWRRYSAHLGPWQPTLAPWVQEFGYEKS